MQCCAMLGRSIVQVDPGPVQFTDGLMLCVVEFEETERVRIRAPPFWGRWPLARFAHVQPQYEWTTKPSEYFGLVF